MKREGAVLVDPVEIARSASSTSPKLNVLQYEFKADLNAYLAAAGPDVPVHSLKEIIEFNERNRDREMPYFGQDIIVKRKRKGR